MRKALLSIALGLALATGGCQTVGTILTGGSAASSAPQAVASAEKALTLAHLAYQGLGDGLVAAARSGVLHGVAASMARSLYDRAGDSLSLADKADAMANAQGVLDAVAAANAVMTQANTLINPPSP